MTTDNGGWTLMTMSSGDPPANLFTTTSTNRNPSSGNVYTNLTSDDGTWYNDIRWGPASSHSTNWNVVSYPVYNERSTGTTNWFNCVGQGCSAFSPATKFKCSWSQSYYSVSATSRVYSTPFSPTSWNIPDYDINSNTWEGILPGINLGSGEVLSQTWGSSSYECNSGDNRNNAIQLWVR